MWFPVNYGGRQLLILVDLGLVLQLGHYCHIGGLECTPWILVGSTLRVRGRVMCHIGHVALSHHGDDGARTSLDTVAWVQASTYQVVRVKQYFPRLSSEKLFDVMLVRDGSHLFAKGTHHKQQAYAWLAHLEKRLFVNHLWHCWMLKD